MRYSWLAIGAVMGLFLGELSAQASDRVCKQWYQKQQYIEASRCFYSLAQGLMNTKITPEQRESVGIWLRNAVLSLRKAADKTKSTEHAAHLREQAISYLDQYLQKKWYDSETQKRSADIQRTRLFEQVGYTQLTITTNHPKAEIKVTGFRFSETKTGVWSFTIRPGNYTVLAKHPQGLTKAKVIQISPRQPQVLEISFATPRTPPRPRQVTIKPQAPRATSGTRIASWVLFGLAGATAITSSIFFGLGLSDQSKADTLYNTKVNAITGKGTAADTAELIRLQNDSNRNLTIAWVGASVAVVSAAVGVILYITRPAPVPVETAPTPLSPRSSQPHTTHALTQSSDTSDFVLHIP